MLNLIDEHTRESLLVRPGCRWSSAKVIEALANVMVMKDVPPHIRSDNGPEFVACELHKWLAATVCATPTLHGTKRSADQSLPICRIYGSWNGVRFDWRQ